MKVLQLPNSFREKLIHGFFDDFYWYISPHLWTSLTEDSGTVAAGASAAGGTLILTTGASDNDEVAVATTNKPFIVAQDKPLVFICSEKHSEGAVNEMDFCMGFSSVMGSADMLVDTTGTPATTFTGAIIYKNQGSLVWQCMTSVGTTQTNTVSANTAASTTFNEYRIEMQPINATQMEVTFYVGTDALRDANGLPIKHLVAFGSTAMQAGAYLKCDSASAEVATLDYIAAYQVR